MQKHYAVTVMEVPWTSMRRAWYLYIWHEETREWQRVKDDVFYAYCYYWHKDATPLDVVQWCKQYLRGQNVAFYESIYLHIQPTTLRT